MNTIHFILNNHDIATSEHPATTMLDFVRRSAHLTGTKEGCREGDCGACTVLVGELSNASETPHITYISANSCLLPLGDMHGKHIVTVEGVTLVAQSADNPTQPVLNLVQQAMADEGGTQCGFCTPGFIVSMTGYAMTAAECTHEGMTQAIDGNVCRCTGYASIKRAIDRVVTELADTSVESGQHIPMLVSKRLLPEYFPAISERLLTLKDRTDASTPNNGNGTSHAHDFAIGGGTDLFVQKPETLLKSRVRLLGAPKVPIMPVHDEGGWCVMDARTPVAAFLESPLIQQHIPQMQHFLTLFASTPIRNRATLGGNINNASPIGDMTAILLALNAELTLLAADGSERRVLLRNYYKGYKTLDRAPNELVETIRFKLPDETTVFNYEKVSRRTYLDIASVNTALQLCLTDGVITEAHASAGGVAAIPLYLAEASSYLVGKHVSTATFREAASIAVSETSPISDARGTADYKRLLLRQLFYAHAVDLFPHDVNADEFCSYSAT
jgi:xanthine dehydrogenase small subunit